MEGTEMSLAKFNNQASVVSQVGGAQVVHGSVFNGPVHVTDPNIPQHHAPGMNSDNAAAHDNDILQLLAFPQMLDRRKMIERPHENTCQWILELNEFKTWSSSSHSLLWIKGKPGAGKSTLMSFLYNRLRQRRSDNEIHLDFFCNARGHELQHKPVGMLRSLLNQLFHRDPEARQPLRTTYREMHDRFGGSAGTGAGTDWEIQRYELEALLIESLILSATKRQVVVIIDALDEMGERHAREVAHYVHQINERIAAACVAAKICISSRHYPISSTVPGVEVWVESHNAGDIATFVHDRLNLDGRTMDDTPDLKQWYEVKTELVHRAEGVFQWIRLVVDILEQYLNAGDSLEDARQCIERVPEKLSAVYEHIIREVIEPRHRQQSFLLFQWVCLARRPLSLTEMRYALSAEDCKPFPYQHRCEQSKGFIKTDTVMRRRLKAFSGGLVEAVSQSVRDSSTNLKDENYSTAVKSHDVIDGKCVVQVIHQSVNDFLLTDGLKLLASMQNKVPDAIVLPSADIFKVDIIRGGHAMIYWSCLKYLSSEDPRVLEADDPIIPEEDRYLVIRRALRTRRLQKRFPLVLYAAEYVFEHAKQASTARGNETKKQAELIEMTLRHWNGHVKDQPEARFARRYTPLHVSAMADLADLVEHFVHSGVPVDAYADRSRTALHLAAMNGHEATAKVLVQHGADVNAEADVFRSDVPEKFTPLTFAAQGGHLTLVRWFIELLQATGESKSGLCMPLHSAAESGELAVVRTLLDAGADPNMLGGKYSTSLQAASRWGFLDIVRLLLNSRADVNIIGGKCGSALMAACYIGHIQIVQKLLDAGANPDALTNGKEGYALQQASENGHLSIVRLLLARGANVNRRGGRHGYALRAACYAGRTEIVQCLLAAGADVNASNGKFSTAIQIVMRLGGPMGLLSLLIKAGADVNTRGGLHHTPLQFASGQAPDESAKMVRFLLEKGADVNAAGGQCGTALRAAVIRCCEDRHNMGPSETVRLLLDARANINAQESNNGTALEVAFATGDETMARYLMSRGAIDYHGLAAKFITGSESARSRLDFSSIIERSGAEGDEVIQFEDPDAHLFTSSSAKIVTSQHIGIKTEDRLKCSHCGRPFYGERAVMNWQHHIRDVETRTASPHTS